VINFRRNSKPQLPWQIYELHIGEAPQNIFWPSRDLFEYRTGDLIAGMMGLDLEAEATKEVYDQLVAAYDIGDRHAFGGVFEYRTRLEIVVALHHPIREWRAEREASHTA